MGAIKMKYESMKNVKSKIGIFCCNAGHKTYSRTPLCMMEGVYSGQQRDQHSHRLPP